ncbi:hypothetical protein OKW32_003139 [Paraburkholderia youngii]
MPRDPRKRTIAVRTRHGRKRRERRIRHDTIWHRRCFLKKSGWERIVFGRHPSRPASRQGWQRVTWALECLRRRDHAGSPNTRHERRAVIIKRTCARWRVVRTLRNNSNIFAHVEFVVSIRRARQQHTQACSLAVRTGPGPRTGKSTPESRASARRASTRMPRNPPVSPPIPRATRSGVPRRAGLKKRTV